jgi:hypothetical protein
MVIFGKDVDKNELVADIYENKRAYIFDKWEDFANQLTDTQKMHLKDDSKVKIIKMLKF